LRYWNTGRRLILIGLVAVFGGTAFILYTLFFWYQDVVVIAPGGVPALEAVRPEQAEVRWMPRASVPPGTLRSPEEVIGKYARRPLTAGQTFLSSDLAVELPRDILLVGGIQIPAEQVLASVKLDAEAGLAGLLRPRSLVDLIAVPKDQGPTVMFAQKVLVVSLAGDQGQPVAAATLGGATLARPAAPGPARPTVAVLSLTPEQALELATRSTNGRVVLALTSEGAPDLALPLVLPTDSPVNRPSIQPGVKERTP